MNVTEEKFCLLELQYQSPTQIGKITNLLASDTYKNIQDWEVSQIDFKGLSTFFKTPFDLHCIPKLQVTAATDIDRSYKHSREITLNCTRKIFARIFAKTHRKFLKEKSSSMHIRNYFCYSSRHAMFSHDSTRAQTIKLFMMFCWAISVLDSTISVCFSLET